MRIAFILVAAALAGCASAQATRTSQNTLQIDAGAAPECGAQGAARVAAKSAAIETLRAGYDRYIITGGQSQNNVSTTRMPGRFQTTGAMSGGVYRTTTTYVPGPTVTTGSHDRSLSVVMFREGEPGAEEAVDAREALGAEWQDLVKSGIRSCL
jgi:hypothetical protein